MFVVSVARHNEKPRLRYLDVDRIKSFREAIHSAATVERLRDAQDIIANYGLLIVGDHPLHRYAELTESKPSQTRVLHDQSGIRTHDLYVVTVGLSLTELPSRGGD